MKDGLVDEVLCELSPMIAGFIHPPPPFDIISYSYTLQIKLHSSPTHADACHDGVTNLPLASDIPFVSIISSSTESQEAPLTFCHVTPTSCQTTQANKPFSSFYACNFSPASPDIISTGRISY